MHRKSPQSIGEARRSAFTLMEVMAALMLTALVAAISSRRFRDESKNVLQAEHVAETIRLELQLARQSAILKSEPYGLAFVRSKGQISSIRRYRRDSSGKRIELTNIDFAPDSLSSFVVNSPTVEFDSEGAASGATRISLETENRQWEINVYAVTGMVRVRQ